MTQQREPHPNAVIIVDWAQGEPIQFKAEDSDWTNWDRGHDVMPGGKHDYLGNPLEWRVAPELTPCEERGYSVGDTFLADVSGKTSGKTQRSERFNVIIELVVDDKTETPLFKVLVSDYEWIRTGEKLYFSLDNVKKIDVGIFK